MATADSDLHAHHHQDTTPHLHPDPDTPDANEDANRIHFDTEADKYEDKPLAVEIARQQVAFILEAYPFDEDSTVVMDYACGTGLISRELAPHTKSIVGVDISQGMVDYYNTRVGNQGISSDEMKAVCIRLKGEDGELDGVRFDVIVCAMAYHHFTDISAVTRKLAFFLKPGGSLIVTDMIRPDSVTQTSPLFPQHYHHIVAHPNAFNEETIRLAFDGAGLRDFQFTKAGTAIMHGKDVDFFLAKGTK